MFITIKHIKTRHSKEEDIAINPTTIASFISTDDYLEIYLTSGQCIWSAESYESIKHKIKMQEFKISTEEVKNERD